MTLHPLIKTETLLKALEIVTMQTLCQDFIFRVEMNVNDDVIMVILDLRHFKQEVCMKNWHVGFETSEHFGARRFE